jgi:phospholipid/cholesterol/gamma-HCH transport system substrate-binding protein
MRSKANLPIFLTYVVISLLVGAFLAVQMGGNLGLGGGYRVTAIFKSPTDLIAGDDVSLAGVRVGQVQSLAPMAGSTAVVMDIRNSQVVPLFADARAVLREKNLLGERYIELNRGSDPGPIPNGGTITEDHTLTPVEVDQVLNALDPQVRDRLDIIINSLGQATAGRGEDLNASAGDLSTLALDLQSIAGTLASNSDHLDALILDLRKVVETIAAWHAQFRAVIADWDNVMATLASREAALQGTVSEQDRVMSIFDQALAGSAPVDLHAALAEAPATLNHTNHYLQGGLSMFAVVQADTPAIAQLFRELASVMSGMGVADESGSPDKGQRVHMWRVYCSRGSACFGP